MRVDVIYTYGGAPQRYRAEITLTAGQTVNDVPAALSLAGTGSAAHADRYVVISATSLDVTPPDPRHDPV